MEEEREVTNLVSMAELKNLTCGLKHIETPVEFNGETVYDPASNHPAVNFLCQKVNDRFGNFVELRIPICEECEEALRGNKWTLLYCISCNRSQWICNRISKFIYTEKVNFLKECPYCKNKGE